MRIKINKFITASLLACLVIGGFVFNACTSTEPVNTITLNAFGPSAALRGGELKFIGTNLDKVTAVDLPGTAEITTFVSKTATQIVVSIPQDTKPGLIVLKTPQGDITTKTPLTFTEPISIDTYTTASVKPGDVFTINGDYLNLIAQVIFSDGAVVDSSKFISHTRKIITLKVPKSAKTGKVALSNGATIPVLVYTAGNAIIANPMTISSISPVPVKAGANLTITGTSMNLVKSVILPDGNKIDSAAITLNPTFTQIVVKVPATAKQGKVKVITYSGIEVTGTDSMKLIVPSITTVSPLVVKNGATLTIKGTNLDLVTGATFTDGVTGTLGTLSSDNTSLEISVPLTAKDGPVVLGTNSGLVATSAAVTLVKPAFTSISPLSLTAGETVTISGTDLDLVRKVIFIGDLTVAVTPAAGAASITVVVPPTGVGTGFVTLETVNGTQVKSIDQLIIIAATTPAITSVTPSVKPGGLMTITGKNLNFVESIYFPDNVKAVLYGVRSENSIEVYVPETAKKGSTTLTMNSFDGKQIVSPVFTISGTDPITDPSLVLYNFDSGLTADGGLWNNVGGLGNPADALSGAYYEIKASNWGTGYWWFAENYISHPSVPKTGYVLKADIRLRNDIPALNDEVRIMLGGKVVNILPYLKVGNVWTTGGDWKTITIPLTEWTDLADPTPVKGGEWGIATYINTSNFTGFCIDNIRYEKISNGSGASQFKLIGM